MAYLVHASYQISCAEHQPVASVRHAWSVLHAIPQVSITSPLHVGVVCADNVAADLIMPTSDPNFPTDYGTDVKPCGYPLLNGHLD